MAPVASLDRPGSAGEDRGWGGKAMASANLERAREAIRALDPEELRAVRDYLDRATTAGEPERTEQEKLDEFHRRLLEKGLIRRIPPPITDLEPYRNRKLIEVAGKPLSETII